MYFRIIQTYFRNHDVIDPNGVTAMDCPCEFLYKMPLISNTFAKFKIGLKIIILATPYCVHMLTEIQYIDNNYDQNKIGEGIDKGVKFHNILTN